MKKKNLLLVTVLSQSLLFACSNIGVQSSKESSVENTSQTESSSTSQFIRTEKLDAQMFESFKKGYQVEFTQVTDYQSNSVSSKIYNAKVNEKNYDVELFSTNKENITEKQVRTAFYHFQPKENEQEEMLYNASLSIGNEVLYTDVLGEDPYTYEEVQITWEESCLSNVFIDLSAEMFVRVADENKFTLSIDTLEETKKDTIYKKLSAQLLGVDLFSNSGSIDFKIDILENTTVKEFNLLTNGNQITGFELSYAPYASYDSTIECSSFGNFLDSGEDVTSFFKPIEGVEDQDFENAMASLRQNNYHLEETQANFDFRTERMVSQGSYKADFYNNEAVVYDYYAASGSKYMNYGYSKYVEGETEYQLGFVKIDNQYYADCLYGGTMEELLPSFKLSSLFFVKDPSSTEEQKIYKINKDIQISLFNYDDVFTPFDADGYKDCLINLTVTIEKDKINIHNETGDTNQSGLILDVTYTQIGKVSKFLTDTNLHYEVSGLTWSQLLSNNEVNYKAIEKVFTKEVLDSIPTLDYCALVYSDVSAAAKPIIFFTYYNEADGKELATEYATKLETAGFTLTNASSKDQTPNYAKTVTIKNKQYQLNVTFSPFWVANSDYGQFQIQIFLSKVQ